MIEERDELTRRNEMIRAARERYVKSGRTKNITRAVDLLLNDEQNQYPGIPARITPREADRPRTILDGYVRPKCLKCGADMFWKGACSTCRGPVKKNQWICKACGFKRVTKDTLEEALAKLERKE